MMMKANILRKGMMLVGALTLSFSIAHATDWLEKGGVTNPESTRMSWWTSGKYLLTKIFPRKNALPPLSARSKIPTASAAAISW